MTMKAKDVKIGEWYWCKVSGQLTIVEISYQMSRHGKAVNQWWATNLKTGRNVFIKSARRLRCRAQADHVVQYRSRWGDKV